MGMVSGFSTLAGAGAWPPPTAWLVGVEWAGLALAPGLVALAAATFATRGRGWPGPATPGPAQAGQGRLLPRLGGRVLTRWQWPLRWAGLPLSPAGLSLVALACGVGGAVLCAALLGYVGLALFAGAVIACMPFVYVQRRAHRQRLLIAEEAERLCITLAEEVKAGVDVGRLLARATLALPPLGPLFARVEQDYRQGVELAVALDALAAWLHLADGERLVAPLKLLSQRGAAIAPLLAEAAEQIAADRERVLELETELAEPRAQFWIVCALTIPLLVALDWGDPAAVDTLLATPLVLLFLLLCANALVLYALVRARTTLHSLYRRLGRR